MVELFRFQRRGRGHYKTNQMGRKFLQKIKDERGQIVLEYMFLLLISVVIATSLLKLTNISDGPVLGWWKKALEFIGKDLST